MSDSLEDRSNDYERRLDAAGNTEELMGALVRTVKRSRWVIRCLVIGSIILAIVIGFVWTNTNNIKDTAQLSCNQSAENSIVINEFLDLLIENTQISTLLTPDEVKTRIAGYKDLIITLPKCYKKEPANE